MEENISGTHTTDIIIYTPHLLETEATTALLNDFIDPDGKDFRKFNFRFEKHHENAIAVQEKALYIIAENELDTLGPDAPTVVINTGSATDTIEGLKDILLNLEAMTDLGFTLADFTQAYGQRTPVENIRRQLTAFRNGIGKMELAKAATIGDGIFALTEEAAHSYADIFDAHKDSLTLKKFVPASGAASRMFKFLCDFDASFDPDKETVNAYINRKRDSALSVFLIGLEKFPFYRKLMDTLMAQPDYASWTKTARTFHLIRILLYEEPFNYANKPKGILPFHLYENHVATPVCEHLKEAVAYAASGNTANVHFTISEEHHDGFVEAVEAARLEVEKESAVAITCTFSYQHKSTDTIAVDMNNKPFRDPDGSLLFRPGGHGALIENLNELDADIVFIKNIDNVSHNNMEAIALYKKALAGGLLELQEIVFGYMNRIDAGEATDALIAEIFSFAESKLSQHIPSDVSKYTAEHKVEYARQLLNRPIRVCGMVKNEGEPGGGPFWIEADRGRLSLQIVESSQVNQTDSGQAEIFAASTHFNPVDIVCGLKDYKGKRFNLREYIDHSSGFIVHKTRFGKDLKSYELPGLWNGAMAGWITLFVEVPLETFNPVKTVNDLLKPAHQPQ